MRAVVFLLAFVAVAFCISEVEMNALRVFYDATNGGNWNRNWNWFQGNPCTDNWWGVKCDGNGHIFQLIMPSNNLVGTLPVELADLQSCTMLAFFNNYLSGTLPEEFGGMKNMAYLQLNFNDVEGPVPESYGNWSNLIELSLIGNRLSGTIPESLGNLNNALYIMMHSNQFVGSIPKSFENFGSATRVKVAQNQLTGALPWTTKPSYDLFDARGNQFSCPLPEWCSAAGDGSCEPCVY